MSKKNGGINRNDEWSIVIENQFNTKENQQKNMF